MTGLFYTRRILGKLNKYLKRSAKDRDKRFLFTS